jgi:hypothetical protein
MKGEDTEKRPLPKTRIGAALKEEENRSSV